MEITFIEQQQLLVEFSGEKYANRFVGVVNVDNDMFTIPEFIQYTGYDINQLYVDKFWNMLNQLEHDDWVYMTEDLCVEFGYTQKKNLNRKIKERCGFTEGIDYVEYTYNDVINNKSLTENFAFNKKKGLSVMSFFKFTKQAFFKLYMLTYELQHKKIKTIKSTFGYIYILHNNMFNYYDANCYKVGCTKSLKNRLQGFSTPYPEKSTFLFTLECKNEPCTVVEKKVHLLLQHYRMSDDREFFICPISVIIECIYTAVSIHTDNIINY